MVIAVTVIHVIVSVGLILVVLLQTGKGAEIGAVFGGGYSSTVFGSSGAGNFLTKLTAAMAIVFMITSLALGYFAGQRPSATIFDRRTAPGAQPQLPTPASPALAPDEQGGAAKNPPTSSSTNKAAQPQSSKT